MTDDSHKHEPKVISGNRTLLKHKKRSILDRGATRSKFRSGQISGEARTEGAKRPRIEGEARTEGEAGDRAGDRSGEGPR